MEEIKETIVKLYNKGLSKKEIEDALSIVIITENNFLTEEVVSSGNFNFKLILND